MAALWSTCFGTRLHTDECRSHWGLGGVGRMRRHEVIAFGHSAFLHVSMLLANCSALIGKNWVDRLNRFVSRYVSPVVCFQLKSWCQSCANT